MAGFYSARGWTIPPLPWPTFPPPLSQMGGGTFLDTLTVLVALELCDVLGLMQLQQRHGKVIAFGPRGYEKNSTARLGYAIARLGRDAIWTFLSDFVRHMIVDVRAIDHLYAIPHGWLKDRVGEPDFAVPIKLFQEHAERHIPLASGQTFLTVVGKRQLHSVASAAKEYEISEERVRMVLAKHRQEVGDDPRTFDADQVHPWLSEEQRYMTTSSAALLRGCADMTLDSFIKRGILNAVLHDPEAARPYRRILGKEVSDLMSRLREKAVAVDETFNNFDMLPLLRAPHRTKCTAAELVDLIVEGRLKRVMVNDREHGLNRFYVSVRDVWDVREPLALRPTDEKGSGVKVRPDGLVTIQDVSKLLVATKVTGPELVRRGIIPSVTRENWKTAKSQVYVHTSAVDDFLRDHVSLYSIAKAHRTSPYLIRPLLEKHKIAPVVPTKGQMSLFFHRAQVEAAGLI